MRTWRKFALATLAAAVALPAFADRGRGHRGGPHRHGWHGHAGWHHAHNAHWHDSRAASGFYVRRHARYRPHSHASFSFGYPAFPRVYSYSHYDYGRPVGTARPNYAASGLLLGALAGAVIGNNSGDLGNSAWRGAALGGVAGLAAGATVENRARERERREAAAAVDEPRVEPAVREENQVPAARDAPRPATNEKSSRMAEANRLFGR